MFLKEEVFQGFWRKELFQDEDFLLLYCLLARTSTQCRNRSLEEETLAHNVETDFWRKKLFQAAQ
jgi:hypothetical protein